MMEPLIKQSSIPSGLLESVQAGTLRYTYKGVSCQKNPFDLALYSKLLWEVRPATLIEIGSAAGGSALWFSDMLRTFELDCQIYSVDVAQSAQFDCEGVHFLQGDALFLEKTFARDFLEGMPRPLLLIEDSAHLYETTLAFLRFFDTHVAPGDYIVVEDGIVDDMVGEAFDYYENGPNRAVETFVNETRGRYRIDREYCDYYGENVTWNTNGYLKPVGS